MTYLTMAQMQEEFDAFKAREWLPGVRCFYSGPMDPLVRFCQQEADRMSAEIEAAGGLDAWRLLPSAPQPAESHEALAA